MDTTKLSFTHNWKGYMLTYRGQNIGGAGVRRDKPGRGSNTRKLAAVHAESARSCIESIKAGHGQKRFLDVIERIDATPNERMATACYETDIEAALGTGIAMSKEIAQ